MSSSTTNTATAFKRLMLEYKELTVNPPEGVQAGPIDESNFFEWEAIIMGPPGTPYEGGLFCATLSFPKDYPLNPPKMKFTSPMYHPNVYEDGRVCISILHAPGHDPNKYESIHERWSPMQSVEKILISVMSMLAEPNIESPANIEAAKIFRDDKQAFIKKVEESVAASLDI